ncbi:hypothetical protein ACLKMY_40200 [Paraburkholderia mimosarum]|uniref:hypothetical protein n=1 Tax=Paraburkholderia mimosarum TaxID=312026 RepID=UPI0012B543D5|nr:hypothetical protein [Paraburkholderia mimosarum]
MLNYADAVTLLPDSLDFDKEFYKKHLDASGIPIVARAEVADSALSKVRRIIDRMVSKHVVIRRRLARNIKGFLIIPKGSEMTTLPEYADLDQRFPLPSGEKWDKRAQGVGWAPDYPYVSCSEANLLHLGLPFDRYPNESICIHEFSHAVLNAGILFEYPSFASRIDALYENAKNTYLGNSYAGENRDEYWAEGSQAWFNAADCTNRAKSPTCTIHELYQIDPHFAREISKWFPFPFEGSPIFP